MADLYRVTVSATAPKKGRTHPMVSLHVIQRRAEGGLRGIRVDHWQQFAGRILWDSEIPAFREGIKDPFDDKARFKFVTKAIITNVVRHDLIRLLDHDRPSLDRLIQLTGYEQLDPAVYARDHAPHVWPMRDDPTHYSHFLDEGTITVSLGIEIPPSVVVGLTWDSAAF